MRPSRTSGVAARSSPRARSIGRPRASTYRPSPMGYAISRAGSASVSAIPSRRRPGGGDSPNSTTSRASDERVRRARSRLQPTAAASAVSVTAWPSQSRRSRSPLPTNARSRLVAKVAATRPRYAHPARTTGATTRCLVRLERTALQAATAINRSDQARPKRMPSRPRSSKRLGSSATSKRLSAHREQPSVAGS